MEHDENKIIVAYDIRTGQETDKKLNLHFPILLICNIICDLFWNYDTKTKDNHCSVCGEGYFEFFVKIASKSLVIIFMNISFRASKANMKIYVYAHNARAYDTKFLMKDIWKRNFRDNNGNNNDRPQSS